VERELLVADLQKSRDALLHSIAGLTEAQWKFKPAPDRWSAAECAEHILREEDYLYNVVTERLMKLPARTPASRTPKQQDERIMAKVLDRTQKQVAAEPMRPNGEFPTETAFRARFVEIRARTIQYASSTTDDLRSHFTPNADFGSMDAYQYLLILSGHCARHTAQIEEVKTSPNFAKP
jgi:DinB family protein